MTSAYLYPLILLPVIIDAPGKYKTRCGETVEVTKTSNKHDFGCHGTYEGNIAERWHKSGRIFASQESNNDIVEKA